MSNTQKKEKMSVVKKMIIALVGGLVVGLIFMFIRSSLLDSGNEGTWDIINKILFQDITAADGTAGAWSFLHHRTALYEGSAGSHRTAGALLPEPCHVQYLQLLQAGKDRRAHSPWLCLLLHRGRLLCRPCGLRYEDSRTFQCRPAC